MLHFDVADARDNLVDWFSLVQNQPSEAFRRKNVGEQIKRSVYSAATEQHSGDELVMSVLCPK